MPPGLGRGRRSRRILQNLAQDLVRNPAVGADGLSESLTVTGVRAPQSGQDISRFDGDHLRAPCMIVFRLESAHREIITPASDRGRSAA